LSDVIDVSLTSTHGVYLKKEHVFTVQTPGRPFYFAAPTAEEASLWIEQISYKIPSKQGKGRGERGSGGRRGTGESKKTMERKRKKEQVFTVLISVHSFYFAVPPLMDFARDFERAKGGEKERGR
jgi:hypothetical protein